jgi:hypothetical protein
MFIDPMAPPQQEAYDFSKRGRQPKRGQLRSELALKGLPDAFPHGFEDSE